MFASVLITVFLLVAALSNNYLAVGATILSYGIGIYAG